MNTNEIQLLYKSWKELREFGTNLVELIHQEMWKLSPKLRHLFPVDTFQQKLKMLMAIDNAISDLEDPLSNKHFFVELGKKHSSYSVKQEDFLLVKQALSNAFDTVMTEKDHALKATWMALFDQICEWMLEGLYCDEKYLFDIDSCENLGGFEIQDDKVYV